MNVIISGASRGIGYQLAKKFALDSHKVIAVARSEDKLAKLVADCKKNNKGSIVYPFAYDLTSNELSDEFPPFVDQCFKKVDILINNAGFLVNKKFMDLTHEDFEKIFALNVKSIFFLIQALKSKMAPGSHIVNIGSMGGFQGSQKFPGLSLYSASKGALATLTECLAVELTEEQISFNCLALGAAQTEMLNEAFPGYKAPLSSSEMADFVMEFAIRGNKFFNGKILPVSLSSP